MLLVFDYFPLDYIIALIWKEIVNFANTKIGIADFYENFVKHVFRRNPKGECQGNYMKADFNEAYRTIYYQLSCTQGC